MASVVLFFPLFPSLSLLFPYFNSYRLNFSPFFSGQNLFPLTRFRESGKIYIPDLGSRRQKDFRFQSLIRLKDQLMTACRAGEPVIFERLRLLVFFQAAPAPVFFSSGSGSLFRAKK